MQLKGRNMKKLIALFILGLAAGVASAQTSITATITDTPDGQLWNNCTWSAYVVSPRGAPTISGTPVAQSSLSAQGTCSSSGVITATIATTTAFDQAGAYWQFFISPNASVPGYGVSATTTGSTQNLSTTLSAGARSPRFYTSVISYGYSDNEVISPVALGTTYYNVTTPCLRQYSNAGFTCGGGGGGGGLSSFTTGNLSPIFTASLGGSPTTAPALAFALSTAANHTFLGNNSGATAAPSYVQPLFADIGGTASLTTQVSGILPVANGGTGTSSPGLVAGTNVTITGSWPNQTINSSGGGGGISGLTTNFYPLASSATTIANGHMDDGVTTSSTITSSEPFAATSLSATTACPGGTGGCSQINEGTVPTGVGGVDILWGSSSTHRFNQLSNNGSTAQLVNAGVDINTSDQVTVTHLSSALPVNQGGTGLTTSIANVTITLPTSAIAATTCTSTTTTTMTNLLTTSAFITAFATDPSGVTGWGSSGGLSWVAWPTANTLNWRVCNVTASSITPGAMSLNVGAR
jgi:hypothetical protein